MATITERKVAPPKQRRGSVVGPVLLVGAGVVLLLTNLGIVEWSVWEALVRLWPVALIAVGLDLLIGGRSALASLFVALLTVGMFVGGFWWFGGISSVPAGARSERISHPAGEARAARVHIDAGVGTLRVEAASATEALVEGEVELLSNEDIRQSLEMVGDTAVYRLTSEIGRGGISIFPFWRHDNDREWSLFLNPDLPTALSVDTGVGEAIVDLEGMTLASLDIHTGVGETTVTLPSTGGYEANIEGGVGEVRILIPDEVAARIQLSTGLGDVDITGDFERDGESYLSPGWDEAEERVTLDVKGGVGVIEIEQIR